MTPKQRLDRVVALVNAARYLIDASSEIGKQMRRELAYQSALSPEGLRYALQNNIHTNPTREQLEKLVQQAGQADFVQVLLSGNVFVAGLQALACAVSAAPHVSVRMSRRDSVFTRFLTTVALDRYGLTGVVLQPSLNVKQMLDAGAARQLTHLHLYGHNETLAQVAKNLIAQHVSTGLWVRVHPAGIGLALVPDSVGIDEAASVAVHDIVPFDQRGCLSLRIVVVQGPLIRAVQFAKALFDALNRAQTSVPLGAVFDDERAQRSRYVHTCCVAGRVFVSDSAVVGVMHKQLWLAPTARCVHVVACEQDQLPALLAPIGSLVAALGIAGCSFHPFVSKAVAVLPTCRQSPLGKMQQPALDGFVDQRSIALMSLPQVVTKLGG